MFFVVNNLMIINIIVIIIRDVSAEDSQESKIKLEDKRARQGNNFDYWEIDHSEASAIYYEPADLFNAKPFDISKNFFIRNPRTDVISINSIEKTHSSTTKEKRNLLGQNTDTSECVNDTALGEGTNILLDVNLATSPFLRNSNSKELTTELLGIEEIQSIEQKLAECIDLHLFKNKDVIENWQLFLSDNKMQLFSKLDQKDIDKQILKKCKHLEDIIENNLDLLKRSMPRRIIDSSVESTTPKLSVRTNKLLTKEVKNIDDPDDSINSQTEDPLNNLSTDSSSSTSHYKRGENSNILSNFSGQDEQSFINKSKTEDSKMTSREIPAGNLPSAKLNELRNIDENYTYMSPNTLDSHPKRNRVNEMAYKESDIKIPKILTKELLNGSVISAANGIETLPNEDFKEFDVAETKQVRTLNNKSNSTVHSNTFNISDIAEQELNEASTLAVITGKTNATNFATEPTASTENTLSQEISHSKEQWLTENKSTDEATISKIAKEVGYETTTNNDYASTIAIQGYETTTDKDYYVESSPDEHLQTSPKETSSLNGTLFLDFNGDLVPTHFVQTSGSINIAIDGKSFCDNVLKTHKSVILLAICKSNLPQKLK